MSVESLDVTAAVIRLLERLVFMASVYPVEMPKLYRTHAESLAGLSLT